MCLERHLQINVLSLLLVTLLLDTTRDVRDVSLERNPPGRGGPLLHLGFSCKRK